MSNQVAGARDFVTEALTEVANPEKAPGMQAYMKTDMPFYGVQKEGRTAILRQLVRDFQPSDRSEYEDLVLGIWALPHREEKYLALAYARHFKTFIVPESLPLYRGLIVGGAWWDFVDEIATRLIRHLVLEDPTETWPVVDVWIDEDDMWLRRAAVICQIGAKKRTDAGRLFEFCAERAFEKEFFIRKAIGWALREYAKTEPEAVARFVTDHRGQLSGLSFREASKHIGHLLV
ncbi:MAG: DNA alkylation repair protein [Actinomycetota bacterium]|nr:DNA alkylation repair protein [Actinomycetota bacterium]